MFGRTSADEGQPIEKKQDSLLDSVQGRVGHVPLEVLFGSMLLGALTMKGCSAFHARYIRRYPNINWMPPSVYSGRRWIKGRVTSANDPDNFRIYHLPSINVFGRTPRDKNALKENTIPIRMAGVDAPELSHFGKPSQPYAQEALQWLKSTIEGKVIYCLLLNRDHHSRAVAVPVLPLSQFWFTRFLGPRLGTNVSKELVKAGWAVTYEQKGAVYGNDDVETYRALEELAKRQRKGIWAKGTKIETPAEYKRRHRADSTNGEEKKAAEVLESQQQASTNRGSRRGLLSRFIPWLR